MLRKIDKNTKKRAIALSAIPIFSNLGFAKTSVESIAKNANVAKGSVYLYYETKEEIILEIWNYINELLAKKRTKNFKKATSSAEKIIYYFDYSVLEEYYEMDVLLRLLAMNMSTILNFSHQKLIDNFKHERADEINTIEKILREGVSSKEFKNINIKMVAKLFANSFHGTILSSIITHDKIDKIRDIIHPQIDFLINSIKH